MPEPESILTKPKVVFTLIYLTYRPGGLDLLVESLKQQLPIYELVVVDDYPGRVERGSAINYIKTNGVNLTWYGPSKEHSYPEHCNGLANAMNTGAIHACTDYVIFLHDFCWIPPGGLLQWIPCAQRYYPGTLLSGIASRRMAKNPEHGGDISIWHTPPAFCGRNIYHELEEWAPDLWENFYTGMPISFIEHINGVDERADCGHIAWPMLSMLHQAREAKVQTIVDRKLRVEMADHRQWKELDPVLWHAESSSKAQDLRDLDQPEWQKISPNSFNLRELRAAYLNSVQGNS